ncbi:MAG: hypothetical protein OEW56_01645 [Gemmatimonadota bacterium]|nr:hypothetical protein [Gemmatimonadota bacterium]
MLVAVVIGACSSTTSVGEMLLGTWSIAGFDDHGTPGVTTGTWIFRADGTFDALGTITYPGEPTDSLRVSGTWLERSETLVDLTVAGETTVWEVSVSANAALLIFRDDDGAVRITLEKAPTTG